MRLAPTTLLFLSMCAATLLSGCPVNEGTCEESDSHEGCVCADDQPRIDGRCPTTDAGLDAATDGSADGAVDAGDGGPCGACAGKTPVCLEDAGVCVQCLDSSQCTEAAAPRCDVADHTCKPCESNADCEGVTGKGVCDKEAEPHACVECTAADDSACNGKVCDSKTHACTNFDPGSANVCQPCVSDAHCVDGQLCIDMAFEDAAVGTYCLWRKDAPSPGPQGNCFTARPYVDDQSNTSVDGAMATVCAPRLSTCAALMQTFATDCGIGTPPAANQDDCGVEGLNDAWCQEVAVETFRCTVPCLSTDDCPIGVSKCELDTPAGRNVCGL